MQTQLQPILVKRYAESRLYDTVATRYLTVPDLRRWKARGISFAVIDAKTGEDVARILLA